MTWLNKIWSGISALLICAALQAADAPSNVPGDITTSNANANAQASSSTASKVESPKHTEAQPANVIGNVAAGAATGTTTKNDQLILDTTVVTGNRELPKVMYIVPWKKAELSNLPAQPFNTLLDDTLQPVDREVFRREVNYYNVIAGKDQPVASEQATPATDSQN